MFELVYLAVVVGNILAVDYCLCRGDELRISIGININVLEKSLSHPGNMGEHLRGR